MELQNEVLAHQLANQEKSLQHNELQLKEKFTEYGALTRQLEAALEEGRKMVKTLQCISKFACDFPSLKLKNKTKQKN